MHKVDNFNCIFYGEKLEFLSREVFEVSKQYN